MGLQRQMERRRVRSGIKVLESTKREHGPLSGALLELLDTTQTANDGC